MNKTTDSVLPHAIDKGLIINKYKGEYQAKRIMMRAGLPVDVINKVLLQDKNITKEAKKPNK